MIFLFSGTDRERAREEMNKNFVRAGKSAEVVRITDANSVADLRAALQGGGMFGGERIVVLDGILANEEMKVILFGELPRLKVLKEPIFIFEGKLDAATRKSVEKFAEDSKRFDLSGKAEKRGDIFTLAHTLNRGDKKALWVGYQRALAREEAPEAIHGVLFWGAKEMLLRSRSGSAEERRGKQLVAELAELPHEARRRGFELEYALEHYILGLPR